jgi:hypothetical protein
MQWPRPPQIAQGVTLAFRIITPCSAVSTVRAIPLPKNIISIPIPSDNRAVEVAVVITTRNTLVSSWPCRNSMRTELVGSMLLENGETVWVVHRVTDIPNLEILNGTPKYFKGITKDDLKRTKNPRILVFGYEKDGSRVILDCAVEIKDLRA